MADGTKIPIEEGPILAVMEAQLDKQCIRYNRESLVHYVQMRLSTAKRSFLGAKPGDPNTLTAEVIRQGWVNAFKAKYN